LHISAIFLLTHYNGFPPQRWVFFSVFIGFLVISLSTRVIENFLLFQKATFDDFACMRR